MTGSGELGHEQPFFAAVAAILCLGLSFGQRVTRVVEVAVGVFLGVLTGDVFVTLFGSGPWQIALAVFIAMSVALWLGARTLMVMQAGIQAAIVVTLLPGVEPGLSRWADALLGCAIALVFALVAPTTPVQRPRHQAAAVLTETAATLRAAEDALRSGDQRAADAVLDRARATEGMLEELSSAASEGVELVRYSPLLRGEREHVQEIAALVAPLDRMLRNLRVLARRVTVSAYRNEQAPPEVIDLLDDVAGIAEFCSRELQARRLPTRARERIVAAADASTAIDHHPLSLSSVVIVAQARSILIDLLELTGLDYADAREFVPEMH
ncbi:MAG: FUSC family protein [Intrasporangiaceae bacterium]|nr:FUSC family protein [Intrasporangiaceae bacterium]